ncbi:SymE family type I addiction module toxin [Marinomonas sp. THO17]|uniref:SymE family type I addiction module toxin n=1 Tax=Marinomonas sp. THO17 TaxID=3149048 RepID=UPI00336BC14B
MQSTSTGHPPLKNDNGAGAWRKISWINLWGFWLEQAGFEIGTPYTITGYNK